MVEHKDIDFITLMQYTTETIANAFEKTKKYLGNHSSIVCSVSGGADSDIMLDMIWRLDTDKKVEYVFVDTGLEMQATKDHIKYLKEKYGIEIKTVRPKEPIPYAVRKHGLPFMNKFFSEYIYRLQKHNFTWIDEPFEILIKKYPKCKVALLWWCNGKKGQNNINSQPYLKEFMISTPPQFSVSNKCCDCAKKSPGKQMSQNKDLQLLGIRKSEGGARSIQYKSCFYTKQGKVDKHFPLFWFLDEDKRTYCQYFSVKHSRAYTEYGFTRTGCAGCPFNSKHDKEIAILEKYEPQLAKAAKKIFAESYEYDRKYREFKNDMKHKNQMKLDI